MPFKSTFIVMNPLRKQENQEVQERVCYSENTSKFEFLKKTTLNNHHQNEMSRADHNTHLTQKLCKQIQLKQRICERNQTVIKIIRI